MSRVAPLALALLTACGSAAVTVIPRGDLPTDVYGSPSPPAASQLPERATVYLTQEERLVPIRRRLPQEAPSLPQAMVETLFEERGGGALGTAIPAGTRVLSVRVQGGVATVDVTDEFERSAPGASLVLRVAQVVYTLTEAPGVVAVVFQIEGSQAGVLTDSEQVVQRPVSRADYEAFFPAEPDEPDEEEG